VAQFLGVTRDFLFPSMSRPSEEHLASYSVGVGNTIPRVKASRE